MANRSDFFAAKIPRSIKRSILMGVAKGYIEDAHHYGDIKREFVNAHAAHVKFRQKRFQEKDTTE